MSLEDLDQFLVDHQLHGSWMRRAQQKPATARAALHWRWADVYPALLQAGSLVPVGPSGLTEMRSIRGLGASGHAIDMNAQILMPGERTRAHRNMRNETRLVHQAPPGAVFVCNNEAFPMERGDLIVSPTWSDHDHFNGGDTAAIWVDGYDTAYARLGAEINLRFPEADPYQSILERADSHLLKELTPTIDALAPRPPVRYPWSATQAALQALRHKGVETNPYDGFQLTFASPVDGGPTLPTIAWHVQLLTAKMRTKAHRHNSTTCYHVFEGQGITEAEGEPIEWSSGDLFVVPPWTWHHHVNASSADAILFSIDDWPAMAKLGFYRVDLP